MMAQQATGQATGQVGSLDPRLAYACQGFDSELAALRLRTPNPARRHALRLPWLHRAKECGSPALAARSLSEAKGLAMTETAHA